MRLARALALVLILNGCMAHAQTTSPAAYVSPLEDRHGWGGKWMAHPGVPALDPITGRVKT